MSNNQQQRPEGQTQNNRVNVEGAKFKELYTNNLGILPNGVTIDISSDLVSKALSNLLISNGVAGVGESVYITATYNQQFDRVIQGKANPKEAIDPFNFYCVLDLASIGGGRHKKGKGGKRFGDKDTGLSRTLNALSNFAVNTSEKAEFEIQADAQLNAVLGELTRDGKVKWNYAKNRKAATAKLDTGLVLNYLLDIPMSAKYVIDVLRARQHKDRRFTATILKTAATKQYKNSKFNPMDFTR